MIDKVKAHVKEHKTVYLVSGALITGVVVGVAVAKIKSGSINITDTVVEGGDLFAVTGSKNTVNKTVIELVERSTPSKPVHLEGTNLYFNSISEAARETGLDRMAISKNIAGTIPDVKGNVFKLLELAE